MSRVQVSDIKNIALDGYNVAHGYYPGFGDEDQHVVVFVPNPPTYNQGLINNLTGSPMPDGMISVSGPTKEIVSIVEAKVKEIKDAK